MGGRGNRYDTKRKMRCRGPVKRIDQLRFTLRRIPVDYDELRIESTCPREFVDPSKKILHAAEEVTAIIVVAAANYDGQIRRHPRMVSRS